MFKIRTTPVEYGTLPYNWDVDSVYQCTWFCYYRSIECSFSPPCYWDRATQNGSYTNAKDWLANYREPWEVKGVDYNPVAGDIAVFDGECGHVQFMETNTMYSEYRNGDPNSFKNGTFVKKSNLLGFLHYGTKDVPSPVERNVDVDQIQTTDTSLRIRTKPSLDGEIVGYVQLGYYNVLDTKDNNGYTWYKIATDRWCANVSTNFLPSSEVDILKEIEKYTKSMKDKFKTITNEKDEYKGKLVEIHKISEVE